MNTQPAGDREHRCFSDEELLELALGKLTQEVALARFAELEHCSDCALVLAEAGRSVAQEAGDPEEPSPLGGAVHAFKTGDVLGNRFRVVRAIGHGGMGDVYEAVDTELGDRIALKTIRAGRGHDARQIERLKQEIRLARRVMHEHVCRVLEFGRHDDAQGTCYFLTMELLSGELLSERLARVGAFSAEDALAVAEQLCAGLEAIHAQGILHRDIKTNNVMLCRGAGRPSDLGTTERAILLDFGIARSLDPDEMPLTTRGVAGTPDYMAPEQLKGETLSPAADIYALGLVLFELLVGQLPFVGETTMARVLKRLESRPPRPSAWIAGIPEQLDELVAFCLEPQPANRPRSAGEVRKAILRVRSGTWAGRPLTPASLHGARTLDAMGESEQPAKRGRARATVLFLSATILLCALAWAWAQSATRAP